MNKRELDLLKHSKQALERLAPAWQQGQRGRDEQLEKLYRDLSDYLFEQAAPRPTKKAA